MRLPISRRTALACITAAPLARSQHRRTYSRVLPDYLRRLAEEAYARRERELAKLTAPDAIEDRRKWVTDTFWRLIGGRPEPCPPNLRITGQLDRQGYRVEKLVYESRPGLHISGNLYIPSGRGPFPGVLFQMGHSLNGKAAEPYQKCCQALARLGYVVLAFDPMGQGERTYYPRPGGTLTRLASADDEHSTAGKQMLLTGDSATRMHTWDAVVSLDVLASHPRVDATRLASTGQSGGGTVTMFLAAVDRRLAAAAVSCGNTENFACAHFNPPGSVDDAEQNFPYSGAAAFDRWDLLYPLAPKPLLVLASTRDFFGTYSPSYLESGQEEFNKLKRAYSVLGAPEKLSWYQTDLPHALSHDLRLKIYQFFERELKGAARSILEEPPVAPEPEANLYVGKSGNVVRDFGSQTPHGLSSERARTLKTSSSLGWLKIPKTTPKLTTIGTAHGEKGPIETLEVESEPGVFLPGYAWAPRRPQALLLILDPRGRTARWREGDLYPSLAAQGIMPVAFDVRCVGDLWPEVGRGNPFYTRPHSEEEYYAWASLMLGTSLLEQRIADIAAIVRALSGRYRRPVKLAARGLLTVPATIAAVVEPAITRLYSSGGLRSYRDLVEAEEYDHPFSNFLPGMLTKTDIPELEAKLGPRLAHGAWDLAGLTRFAQS